MPSIRQANIQKKWLTCLRCGRKMKIDRCHRLCRRCRLAIQGVHHQAAPVALDRNALGLFLDEHN